MKGKDLELELLLGKLDLYYRTVRAPYIREDGKVIFQEDIPLHVELVNLCANTLFAPGGLFHCRRIRVLEREGYTVRPWERDGIDWKICYVQKKGDFRKIFYDKPSC